MHEAISRILSSGQTIKASRGALLELQGTVFRIDNPRTRLSLSAERSVLFSAVGELLWYLRGSSALKVISYYLPVYKKDSSDGYTIHGAYGPRILDSGGHDQLANVIKLLKAKPTTRRAVISLFRPDDISRERKEVPCTVSLQFMIRDGRLNCIATMRSNDAILGLPHDVFTFTMLQEIIAREVNVGLGYYQHAAASFHIYTDQIDKAGKYLAEGLQSTKIEMPKMDDTPMAQWLPVMLDIERHFRKFKRDDEQSSWLSMRLAELPVFWQDIARILAIFRYTRNNSTEEWVDAARRLLDDFSDPIYENFVQAKIDKHPDNSPQLDLK